LNNPIYDNSCVNGDFSHSYIIVNEYFGLMLKMQKNPKMNFNGQPNMSFGNIISYTCDLHLKLDIFEPT